MKKIEDYTPTELATISTILGFILASKYDVEEQNVVANLLFGIAPLLYLNIMLYKLKNYKRCNLRS